MHPGARGTAFLLFIGAILVGGQWWLLLAFLVVALTSVCLTASRRKIIVVTLKALLPAIAFLSMVRLWIVSDSIGETAVTGLRLLDLGLAFQLLFVPLNNKQVVAAFDCWRFPSASGTLWLSAISSSHDLRQKYVQAHEAMLARGLIGDGVKSRIGALPMLLQAVFTNAIRGAIGRVDLWYERNIMDRLRFQAAQAPRIAFLDGLVVSISLISLIAAGVLRVQA